MISTLHPLSSLFFFFLKKIFIYLTALGLSCRMWDLSLLHAGISFLTRYWTWAPALGAQSLRHWTTREVPLQPLLMPSLFALSTSQPLVCITSCFHDLCLLSFAMNILFTSLAAVNSCASCISQPNHYFLREASPDFPRAHNTHTHTHTHTGSSWWSLGVWCGPQSPSKSESLFCVFLAISGSSKIFWLFLNLADHQNDEESLLLFVFWSYRTACGILVPRLGIEPMLSAVEARSLNPWTNWEILRRTFSK